MRLYAQNETPALDFNSVGISTIESAKGHTGIAILLAIFLFLLCIIIAWAATRRDKKRNLTFQLNQLPPAAKLIPTIFLVTFLFVHIIALADAMVQSRVIAKNVHEYFHFMKYSRLLGVSHSHLFGHTVMYSLVALPFAFTTWREFIKALFIAGAMVSAVFDVGSWWLIKYFGEEFEIISAVSGITFTISFLVMAAKTLRDLWKT